MIPMWLKIFWNVFGFAIFIYSIFPLSGWIVLFFTESAGSSFHPQTKKELYEATSFAVLMLCGWMVMFVVIMIIYQIPINQWIG